MLFLILVLNVSGMSMENSTGESGIAIDDWLGFRSARIVVFNALLVIA